jgi:biopolymer transport protein ExbB/TolQ
MGITSRAESQYRVSVALAALMLGAALIGIATFTLSVPEHRGEISASAILLDRGADKIYPLTIQNVMWLIFFIGLGELWVRFQRGSAELRMQQTGWLPDDESSMLRGRDLGPIYKSISQTPSARDYALPRLIQRVILQFQSSGSISQANNLMNSSLELMQHEIDLKYNMLRYIMWLIPTLGFIGTVIGIALALNKAGNMPDLQDSAEVSGWVTTLTGSLGLAFNTTLLALLLAAVLVFLMHIAQGREEAAINSAGQICLDNLINRLYEED